MEQQRVVWLSVDPVRRKVDFYPTLIAQRIEKEFSERDRLSHATCVLGKDFFNATIHFHINGSFYQTTPGVSMGYRGGFKQPGYRSVLRNVVPENGRLKVYAKSCNGEWRIAATSHDSDIEFDEAIPEEAIITGTEFSQEDLQISPWKSEELSDNSDKLIVIWQWCRGTYIDGDPFKLSDQWWVPYNQENNESIENAFVNNLTETTIELPVIGSRKLVFVNNSSYAMQNSMDNAKVRNVRRVLKTVAELNKMFDSIQNPPVSHSEILAGLSESDIPHQFLCPILQEIMTDPVKTVDGFTYERDAIQRWFQIRVSSPLTGLDLQNSILIDNVELRETISTFVKELQEKNSDVELTANATAL